MGTRENSDAVGDKDSTKKKTDGDGSKPHSTTDDLFAIPELQKKFPTLSNKVFINFTQSEKVDLPSDSWGNKVNPNSTTVADGLTLPMSIGQPRPTKDNDDKLCLAVDVVLHPWVIKAAKVNGAFKLNVVDLAIDCLLEDVKLKIMKVNNY